MNIQREYKFAVLTLILRGQLRNFLTDAAYSDAKPVITPTNLKSSAENWDQANQGIMLVVGYPNTKN